MPNETCESLEVTVERCDECGFDGDDWTDARAVEAITALPGRWREALADVPSAQLQLRPVPDTWSIAEYADHVREVLFGMRFVLDTAVADPGVDLGDPPASPFDPVVRQVDIDAALAGVEREAGALVARLSELAPVDWDATATVGADTVDAHWIARHAVHDATHHLLDVERLRSAL